MTPGFSGMELLRLTASTLLVLALLAGLLYLLKRMQSKMGVTGQNKKMRLIESLSLNTRQKIACVQMDGHTILIGVGPAQLSCLAHWKNEPTPADSHASWESNVQARPGDHHGA